MPVLLALIPTLPRARLARLTQAMIDRMDTIAGDYDLEDDEPDEEHDGREQEVGVLIALYGRNQTLPPQEGGGV